VVSGSGAIDQQTWFAVLWLTRRVSEEQRRGDERLLRKAQQARDVVAAAWAHRRLAINAEKNLGGTQRQLAKA